MRRSRPHRQASQVFGWTTADYHGLLRQLGAEGRCPALARPRGSVPFVVWATGRYLLRL
jgi:hypothetical protein